MKVVFFGTPEYAVPSLQAIISSNHQVVAVVTQPDKPVGRSNKLVPTPVKKLAMDNNIPVFQYERIRKSDITDLLSIDADIYVTCAYGQILDEKILFAKKHGVINLHGSLLPKYRGASPVQCALIGCEKETGVTILQSGVGLDDGDIITMEKIAIDDNDNAITLFDKLSLLSAKMIVPTLDNIEKGNITFTKQDESLATKCSMFKPEMGIVDFNKSAEEIVGLIKGLAVWPNVRFTINGVYFKLYNAVVSQVGGEGYEAGQVVLANNKQGLHIKCGNGVVEITELLPINSKRMTAKSYLNGKSIEVGSKVE